MTTAADHTFTLTTTDPFLQRLTTIDPVRQTVEIDGVAFPVISKMSRETIARSWLDEVERRRAADVDTGGSLDVGRPHTGYGARRVVVRTVIEPVDGPAWRSAWTVTRCEPWRVHHVGGVDYCASLENFDWWWTAETTLPNGDQLVASSRNGEAAALANGRRRLRDHE